MFSHSFNNVYRNRILASAFIERVRTGREAQAFGGFARRCDVHLRRNDGSAREERLLALGRQQRLVVHAEEQTRSWAASWSRGLQTAELHAHLRRRERRFSYQRALEVSFRYDIVPHEKLRAFNIPYGLFIMDECLITYFSIGTETWEKLTVAGPKPQPRAESVALAVSELLIRGSGTDNPKPRLRNQRPRLSSNRMSPCEAPSARPSFLKEISKLSQINLSRLSHPTKCSYSVLSGHDDNEESPQEVYTRS